MGNGKKKNIKEEAWKGKMLKEEKYEEKDIWRSETEKDIDGKKQLN